MKIYELYRFEFLRLIKSKNIVFSLILSILTIFMSPLSKYIISSSIYPPPIPQSLISIDKYVYIVTSYLREVVGPLTGLYIYLPILLLSLYLYELLDDSFSRGEASNRIVLPVQLHTYLTSKVLAAVSISLLYSLVIYMGIFISLNYTLESLLIVVGGLSIYILIYAYSILVSTLLIRSVWLSILIHIFLVVFTNIVVMQDINIGGLTSISRFLASTYNVVLISIFLGATSTLDQIRSLYGDQLDEITPFLLDELHYKYSVFNFEDLLITTTYLFTLFTLFYILTRRYEIYEYI